MMKLDKWGATFLILFFFVSTNGFAGDTDNARLITSEEVTMLQNAQKIAEYTQETPFPEDTLLSCEGKCAIRLSDMSIVAEDQSQFSVDTKDNSRHLIIKKGTVYFGLSAESRSLVLITPKGAVAANQIMINASNKNMVEGYIKVADETSELGIIDGGSILLATKDGQQRVKSGESYLLAQADMGGNSRTGGGSTGGSGLTGKWTGLSPLTKGAIIGGAALGAGGIGYAIERHNDDSHHHHHAASPSAP